MKDNARLTLDGHTLEIEGITQIGVKKNTTLGESTLFKKENEPVGSNQLVLVIHADRVIHSQEGVGENDVFE